MKRYFLFIIVLLFVVPLNANAQKVEASTHEANSTGEAFNKKNGLIVHFGPAGVQFGHPNPLGIPPSLLDIEVTYLHSSGIEGNFGIVPGLTCGSRYRMGSVFYGSLGGGIIMSTHGIGPGVYSAIGMSTMRYWPVTFEAEFKQALTYASGVGRAGISTPYALRIGGGFYW